MEEVRLMKGNEAIAHAAVRYGVPGLDDDVMTALPLAAPPYTMFIAATSLSA